VFKITGTVADVKFDVAGFRKSVDAAIEKSLRNAAQAWLRAVIPHVPVYTGTARGSLKPLGAFIKVAIPISPVAVRKGMGPDVGASKQEFSFTNTAGQHLFSYSTGVQHFITNNYYNVPLPLRNPTPWGAFERGNEAFMKYLREDIPKRIPRVKPYITFKLITVGN
jgi:hypothetical protein